MRKASDGVSSTSEHDGLRDNDALPHHFHEFDVLDQEATARFGEPVFLATEERHELLKGLPFVHVPVLWKGPLEDLPDLRSMVVRTPYKTDGWRESFASAVDRAGLRMEDTVGHIEDSDLMEGLYLKVERNGRVVSRYKFVRGEFVQTIVEDNSHWLSRPFVHNGLQPGRDILAWNVDG